MLQSATVATVGLGAFTGVAAASDDTAIFDIECRGDEVEVTLTRMELYGGGTADPTELDNLRVFLGTFANINIKNVNNRVDVGEIEPCFAGGKSGTCPSPIARPERTETESDSITYYFDRSEAGLDEAVNGQTDNGYPDSVVLAGVYEDADGNIQAFDSYGELQRGDVTSPNVVTFDPADCCTECESGDGLLVKYEWSGGEFVVEEGGDDGITLDSVELDEDGEPARACFTTDYCAVDAVVKAGPDYEVTEITDGGDSVCVSGIDGRAISNVRFYCVAPDDLRVGNGEGPGDDRDEDSDGGPGNSNGSDENPGNGSGPNKGRGGKFGGPG